MNFIRCRRQFHAKILNRLLLWFRALAREMKRESGSTTFTWFCRNNFPTHSRHPTVVWVSIALRAWKENSHAMWFVYASLLFAVIAYAVKKYGLNFYRFRPPFLRRLVGKTRPSTPPLLDQRRYSREISNEHSVFQVFDDGTIIASKVERPQPVIQTKS